jgi:hypothetical protein
MALARRVAHGLLLFVTVVCGMSCKQMFQWSNADDFRFHLRCGMSVREVSALAQRYGAKGVERSESSRADGLQAYWVEQRNTRFYFGFQGDALIKVQKARGYGLTGLELFSEENLCSTASGAAASVGARSGRR